MIVGHNISEVVENLVLQEEVKSVNQMSSYMSHEMITPLKCLGQLTDKIGENMDEQAQKTHYLRLVD